MSHDKVFVCKYVSTPGVGERLQPSGQNPISVSTSAIKSWPVAVGSYFADGQDRSYVLAFDTGQDEPSVEQCPVPETPAPTVTTSALNSTTCAAFTTTTTTTTTPFMRVGGAWVPGTPVVTTDTVTSTPTDAQIKTAGLTSTCTQSGGGQTGDNPLVVVVTETSDGVQIAAAHPLPSAARAGDADTGGQLAAGGLAGIGALLAMGAGFVLRRREGEV